MKNLIGWTVCLACLLSSVACTTVDGTLTRACDVSRTSLDTGFDHLRGRSLEPGDVDVKWIVIADPDPGTVEPRPAAVISNLRNGNEIWRPAQGDSQWIGPYPAGTENPQTAPGTGADNPYSYLYCFCSRGALAGSLRADNEATVFLNDVQIAATAVDDTFRGDPLLFQAAADQMRNGINCLRVDVQNGGANPTGLDIQGAIASIECCSGRVRRPLPPPGVTDPLGQDAEQSLRRQLRP